MIIIWDNGENYEDHRVHHVDAGSRALELEELLDLARDDGVGHVLGVAKTIAWRGSYGAEPLKTFLPMIVRRHAAGCDGWDEDEPCTCWVLKLLGTFPDARGEQR